MADVRNIGSLKEATDHRLQAERRLVELLENRREQIKGVRGVPGANADELELELQRHVYEAARVVESSFAQQRQFWLTLLVAGVAAFATVVYAATYAWAVYVGKC
jgi:hypothetical protein